MARTPYTHGSAARQQQVPRERYKPAERQKILHQRRRNREKALHMNLLYVLLLTAASVIAFSVCIQYLKVQSSVTARVHSIEGKEKELVQVKAKNDAAEARIHTYVDLDYIYKVATEELGMVYVNKNQIILYDRSESGYVHQNEDIPE